MLNPFVGGCFRNRLEKWLSGFDCLLIGALLADKLSLVMAYSKVDIQCWLIQRRITSRNHLRSLRTPHELQGMWDTLAVIQYNNRSDKSMSVATARLRETSQNFLKTAGKRGNPALGKGMGKPWISEQTPPGERLPQTVKRQEGQETILSCTIHRT